MLIPYEIFNAACICAGSVPTQPDFFRVILITPDCRLVSTDGHLLYVSNAMVDLPSGLLKVHEKPKKCLLVDLRLSEGVSIGFDKDNNEKWRIPISRSENDFPDWNRIIWEKSPEANNLPIGWGLPVLKKICAAFGTETSFNYESGGLHSPAKLTGNHGVIWAMPCRLK